MMLEPRLLQRLFKEESPKITFFQPVPGSRLTPSELYHLGPIMQAQQLTGLSLIESLILAYGVSDDGLLTLLIMGLTLS